MSNGNKRSKDDDATRMRDLGYELRAPVDEYSDQPDSGSSIGGIRGQQEYGISGGIADESDSSLRSRADSEALAESTVALDSSQIGISEFSDHITQSPDDVVESKTPSSAFDETPTILRASIYQRLKAHKLIDASALRVHVAEKGTVLLQGDANSPAERSRIEDIVRAVPGVKVVANKLEIPQ